ncbi:porin [Desulfoluna spongiiphila]|uniref:porin n=1 Tax=Desulfoluna spongiiphila TaxID=419481 RepID=UPI00125141ED|nr:hypothetical protein [Desulfoluna spongiiphila]VVS92759.1 porin domain superfamily [Desulfoluna spongiiphila]
MKSRMQKLSYVFVIAVFALSVIVGTAYGAPEKELLEMQTQLADQAKALEEMRATIDALTSDKESEVSFRSPFVFSGNKASSVVLYGHVNRALLAADDGNDSDVYQVDNSASQSRFGIRGTIKVSDDLMFGTLLEAGLNVNPSDSVSQENPRDNGDSNFTRRHVDLYVKHKGWGTFSMGHGSTASDDTTSLDLSGTYLAGASAVSDYAGGLIFYDKNLNSLTGVNISKIYNSMDGLGRDARVRYDSPSFGGAMISGSWVADGGGDVAVRYDGELADIQVVGAIAYARPSDTSDTVKNLYDGSVALLFDSGFNLAFASGLQEYKQDRADDGTFYYLKLGYKAMMASFGETRFSVDFGQYDDNLTISNGVARQYGKGDVIGAQVVQDIKDFGTELYAGYYFYDLDADISSYESIHALITGLRIKF